MADWLQPTTSSTYASFLSDINARLNDLAFGSDPAVTTETNVPTNAIRWNSANSYWEKYSGTAWAALSSSYAISISGSATKLTTPRSITLNGYATGTVLFDGSGDVSIPVTLVNSGVGVGSYGSAGAVPVLTIDAKGRATAAANTAIAIAWTQVTSGLPNTLAGYGITNAVTNAGGVPAVLAGLVSAMPAAGVAGRLYTATDSYAIYQDTGSAWVALEPALSGDVSTVKGGLATTLATVNGSVGTYGDGSSVPVVTVNGKGLVTGVALANTVAVNSGADGVGNNKKTISASYQILVSDSGLILDPWSGPAPAAFVLTLPLTSGNLAPYGFNVIIGPNPYGGTILVPSTCVERLYMPDGTSIGPGNSFTMPSGTGHAFKIHEFSGSFRLETIGRTIVAPAVIGNEAVALSQLQSSIANAIGNLNSAADYSASQVLPNSAYGQAAHVAAGVVLTLPASNGTLGQCIYFYCQNSGSYSIVNNTGQFIYNPAIGMSATTGTTTLNVPNGGTVMLMSRGSGEFDVIDGSVLITNNINPLPVVSATAPNQAVALGQSLSGSVITDVTASRAFSVIYTNTTSRAKFVSVTAFVSSTAGVVTLDVGTIQVSTSYCIANTSTSVSAIIQPGGTYEVTAPSGAGLPIWSESI